MKTATVVGLCLWCLIACGQASAGLTGGEEIQKECEKPDAVPSAFSNGFCAGFVTGVVEAQTMWERRTLKHPSFCLPEKSTNGQILKVFTKYLDDHPEELHQPAALLLVTSLRHAFPCGK